MGSCKSRRQCNQVCAQSVNYHVLAPPCAPPCGPPPCGPGFAAGPYGGAGIGLPYGAFGPGLGVGAAPLPVGLVGGYGPGAGACGLAGGPC